MGFFRNQNDLVTASVRPTTYGVSDIIVEFNSHRHPPQAHVPHDRMTTTYTPTLPTDPHPLSSHTLRCFGFLRV